MAMTHKYHATSNDKEMMKPSADSALMTERAAETTAKPDLDQLVMQHVNENTQQLQPRMNNYFYEQDTVLKTDTIRSATEIKASPGSNKQKDNIVVDLHPNEEQPIDFN